MITVRKFWSSDHWIVYSLAWSLTAVKLGLSPMVFSDCISLAKNCETAFNILDTRMTMNIKLSCSYQNTRLKYDKFPVFSIVSRVAEATVTTGLSRARHCTAAIGSHVWAGPHGMGVALLASVQWDWGNRSRETGILLIWLLTIGRQPVLVQDRYVLVTWQQLSNWNGH